MRRLLPVGTDTPGSTLSVDDIADLYRYPAQGSVRANMVSSLDGAVSADGRSKAISGPPDVFMFGLLRALADVVVVGAGTARTEGYGPGRARKEFAHLRVASGQSPAPTMAVVTRSGNLDVESPLLTDALTRTVVITCEAAPADARQSLSSVAEVVIAGDSDVDLPSAFDQLHERGYRRVLVEGGPRLLGDVATVGRLDELALSVSPVLAGGSAGRIVNAQAVLLQQMELRVLLSEVSFLFGLYVRATEGTTAP